MQLLTRGGLNTLVNIVNHGMSMFINRKQKVGIKYFDKIGHA